MDGVAMGTGNPPLDRAVFVRPIAHRGWHDKAKGRLENTAPAFRAAIEKGYGIECDLQGAADGTPMVFHDAELDRLVAGSGPISAYAPASLARLRYKGQDERILGFGDLLDLAWPEQGGGARTADLEMELVLHLDADRLGQASGFLEARGGVAPCLASHIGERDHGAGAAGHLIVRIPVENAQPLTPRPGLPGSSPDFRAARSRSIGWATSSPAAPAAIPRFRRSRSAAISTPRSAAVATTASWACCAASKWCAR